MNDRTEPDLSDSVASQHLPSSAAAPWRPLGLWLWLMVLLNVLCSTNSGFEPDVACWVDWSRQLNDLGYAGLEGNYPPLFTHWLWLVGHIHDLLGVTPQLGGLLRLLAITPVIVAHGGLLWMMDRLLRASHATERQSTWIMAFAVFSPALLMNGPIWGQVDLLFSFLIVSALLCLIYDRYLLCVFPLLTLAVLTKFQAICIGPAVLPLLWHRRRPELFAGLLLSIPLAAVLVLPYVMTGSLGLMIDKAYIGASGLFPVSSYNAANLWTLIGMNEVQDSRLFYDHGTVARGWQLLFTPHYLGIAMFGAWSLWLVVDGLRHDVIERHWRNAMLSIAGFFLFLPAMHERYLFPAAVVAMVALACDRRFAWHAVVLSLLTAANMAAVMKPAGGALLHLQAVLIFVTIAVMIVGLPCASALFRRAGRLPLWLWLTACVAVWGIALAIHLYDVRQAEAQRMANFKARGWMDAAAMQGRTSHQEWGQLQEGRSVGQRPLTVAGRRYLAGLGTHARSSILIPIPDGATAFSAQAGLDDEEPGGLVRFEVYLDGQHAWTSPDMPYGAAAQPLYVDVRGKRVLELRVDPMGSNSGDHADWLEPRFLFERR